MAAAPRKTIPTGSAAPTSGSTRGTIKEQLTPYVRPEECGNHESVRWAALTGRDGAGLLARAVFSRFQASALPFSDEELAKADYAYQLPPSGGPVFCFSAKTLGIGSASCGPRPLEKYITYSDPVTFSYMLRPIPPGVKDLAAFARERLALELSPASVKSAPLVDRSKWKIVLASSFEPGEGNPEHAIDNDPATFWHTRYSPTVAQYPHELTVDFGEELPVAGVAYRARLDMDHGRIKDYEIYLSRDASNWGQPAATGQFANRTGRQVVSFKSPVTARYLKLIAKSEVNGKEWASIGDLTIVPARGKGSSQGK